MPATKDGIFHNLKESEYTVSNSEIVFFFSSKFYLNKFMEEYKTHREKFNRTTKRITIDNPLNMEILADITLYRYIEKRGFLVWLKGSSISWEELHRYALRKMTEPNTEEWAVMNRSHLMKERFKHLR
jgi:hypothetical protein